MFGGQPQDLGIRQLSTLGLAFFSQAWPVGAMLPLMNYRPRPGAGQMALIDLLPAHTSQSAPALSQCNTSALP